LAGLGGRFIKDETSTETHAVRIFLIVAGATLLPLLLFARLASGKDQASFGPLAQGAEPAASTALAVAPAIQAPKRQVQLLSAPPDVGAHAYAVLDRSCGAVIAVKNPNERMPPASLTKIVTAMVVRNRVNLDDVVLVNVSGKRMAAKGSSVMGIEPGMLLSVETCSPASSHPATTRRKRWPNTFRGMTMLSPRS
jgi:hypothetical protein